MKKLLLVAVSVGVFLLITITVSLVILTPGAQTQEATFVSTIPPTGARPIQDIADNIPAESAEPAEPEISDIPTAPILEERPEVAIADRNDGERVTIQIPRPPTTVTAIPDTPQAPAAPVVRPPATPTPAPTTPAVATQPPARQTAPTAATATTATPAPRTTPTPAPAPRPAPTRTVHDYWVQTGAFSAMIRAEDARERLASQGLVSIIETRNVNGRIWYRVRLGPYTSEREATHWLAIVREIDGFRESQVRQTTRVQ
ncbi:MAG: SPOR domain-containing protein [Treponema sp.]|nr:SPOR domain-containing protein [Treponema sp.]